MAVAFRRLKKVQVLPEAEVRVSPAPPKDLTWEAAITLFLECWGADHPGVRPGTMGHYRDQLRTILTRIAEKAGVDPALATPHRLRHYFGLTSAMAGVPTTALMRAMGHRSPIMTARYSEFADSQRRWAFARADITKGIIIPSSDTLALTR